jgi:hypothetical protein
MLMLYITGEERPLCLRIVWISIPFSIIALSLSLIIFTSQLKKIILKRNQQNRVVSLTNCLAGSITVRHNRII